MNALIQLRLPAEKVVAYDNRVVALRRHLDRAMRDAQTGAERAALDDLKRKLTVPNYIRVLLTHGEEKVGRFAEDQIIDKTGSIGVTGGRPRGA